MTSAYDPARELWHAYRPQQARWRCTARTPAVARAWQERVRPQLQLTLGFDSPRVPARARLLSRVDRGDFICEQHELSTATGSRMPFFLLRPSGPSAGARVRADASGRRPLVVACTGHGYGAREIVGLAEDGSERAIPDGYQQDFAVSLCRRGFTVVVPEIAGFGQRQSDFSELAQDESPVPTTCKHLATLSWHLGGSVVGMRVRDLRRLLDHVITLPGIDGERVGVMGISGGGMLALFAAALEVRLRAVVISGYFSTFRNSILAMRHCWCNFVPNLHQFGEMHDLAALIAPRPLLVEAGTGDPIFPLRAVREGLRDAHRHYALHRAQAALVSHIFKGDHRIDGGQAYDFLCDQLDPVLPAELVAAAAPSATSARPRVRGRPQSTRGRAARAARRPARDA